jgi:dGTPase
MKWELLLNVARYGETGRISTTDIRSQFQRDYDRLIFSPEFRKLQSKTQVFPLPGDIFVHNRLTHSLEVASVGRSIASLVADFLVQEKECTPILANEIPTIVATACLAHDMGNPPFGHSGEDAISSYFSDGEGVKHKCLFSENEWTDLTHFEGNANVLRLLTHQFSGRREGGFALTYATLASMIKYPFPSSENRKKYGYFVSETAAFNEVVDACGLANENGIARHPLVYLVEAADDISYLIMDMEDAHRLGIIDTATIYSYLLPFLDVQIEIKSRFQAQSQHLSSAEKVAYLRSLVINTLVRSTASIFAQNYSAIIQGNLSNSLASMLPGEIKPLLERCKDLGKNRIYCDPGVQKLELSGHRVLTTLMQSFTEAVFAPQKLYSKLLLSSIHEQYKPEGSPYKKIRLITDFLSSMTDIQAVKIYRELMGIDIPQRPDF